LTLSHPSKKTSIPSLEEYDRLLNLYHDAYDRLQFGEAGAGYAGIHFAVMHELSLYGIPANGRDDAVWRLKQLLDEYEGTRSGSAKTESEEEYMDKFEDL
jgi:hypothetical protein